MPKPLALCLKYLKENDMAKAEAGVFDLKLGNSDCILQVLDLQTNDRNNLRPEIHRKYIDVQFLASGGPEEAAFWSDDCSLEVDENLLSTKRDILFYKNSNTIKEGRIYLTPGTYACYFPWDVHVPAIKVGKEEKPIRKIVIKIPLEDCYK
jgi:YhcH/YjgK/YiaL family protein